MLIIDVGFSVLKEMSMGFGGPRLFYMNKLTTIEIYAIMSGIIYRYIYDKQGEEQDRIFLEQNMGNSVPIEKMSFVNEPEWQEWATQVIDELRKIRDEIYGNK